MSTDPENEHLSIGEGLVLAPIALAAFILSNPLAWLGIGLLIYFIQQGCKH